MVLAKLKPRSLLFYRKADCTKYGCDGVGQRITMCDPDNGRFSYNDDGVGRITSLRNPQSERTTFYYYDGSYVSRDVYTWNTNGWEAECKRTRVDLIMFLELFNNIAAGKIKVSKACFEALKALSKYKELHLLTVCSKQNGAVKVK